MKGTCSWSCKALYETVLQAVKELGLDAQVIKEEDMMNIMSYNVMILPGLVIDNKVVSKGKKLSLTEVKEILSNR